MKVKDAFIALRNLMENNCGDREMYTEYERVERFSVEPAEESRDSSQLELAVGVPFVYVHTDHKATTEKDRRVYYQSIVYEVCNILDNVRDFDASRLVCGTHDNPSTEIRNRLEKLVNNPVRMWTVKVYSDHEVRTDRKTKQYTVPASTKHDAKLMAFILDKGLEDDKYGDGSIVELGELELAKMFCEITNVKETTCGHR